MDQDHCARCGRPSYSEEQLARAEADPEELVWPERLLYNVPGQEVCWDCMSLVEQRTENFQCARCGAQFHDDGRASDGGWITGTHHPEGILLCPDCQTDAEARADVEHFVAMVQRGQRLQASKGEPYPTDLAELGDRGREWLAWREQENAGLARELGEEPEV